MKTLYDYAMEAGGNPAPGPAPMDKTAAEKEALGKNALQFRKIGRELALTHIRKHAAETEGMGGEETPAEETEEEKKRRLIAEMEADPEKADGYAAMVGEE